MGMAVGAYLKGNRRLAKQLSTWGRGHQKEMKRLHRAAAERIFKMRNGKGELGTIDLHGLHVEEGIERLKERIEKVRKALKKGKRKGKGKKAFELDILTGTGHHSFRGRGKLGPAILTYVKSKKIKCKEMDFVDGRGGNIR